MKKSLILLLITLLIVLSIYICLNGFAMGEIEVLSYPGIRERNSQLDTLIQDASKLAQSDYRKAINDVEESTKELIEEKSEYEELTLVSTEGEIKNASQLEKYDLETLWVKIGNHATSEGVIIKMDVKNGSSGVNDYYNLQFDVTGSYISITDFISDIENDSTLGFKIEEFNMIPATQTDLRATFVCKDIAIDHISQISTSSPQSTDNKTEIEEDDSTNTTNTTNTTSDTSDNIEKMDE